MGLDGIRDLRGRFIKGVKLSFPITEKKKIASIKNLGSWIGRVPPMLGKKHSFEAKRKMSHSGMGKHIGENNGKWISDRSKLAKRQKRNDYSYIEWRKSVMKRDEGKCRMGSEDCFGYMTVHHILSWKKFPNERYNVNNGITLCQTHHPRKRVEEKRLVPFLQRLIIKKY
jgi:hypothetical protein